MEITLQYVDGVTILGLAGRFVVGSTDTEHPPIARFITELIAAGRVDVMIDLARLTKIDAHGIGQLAWSLATLRRCGGRTALIAPSRHVRRMLAVTKVDTLSAVYDSEPEAIASTRRRDIRHESGYRSPNKAPGACAADSS